MPDTESRTGPRGTAARRQNGHASGARAAMPERTGGEGPSGAPGPGETWNGERRGRGARRATPAAPEGALRGLFRGLRAGDLDTVLLTVAMAAEENRMPCADPDEEARILAFLARLAEHDAALPPPDGAGVRSEEPSEAG